MDEEDIEYGVLRQGDIIRNIHLLGAINLRSINYISDHQNKCVGWTVHNEPTFANALVLSHSCEIDPANKTKLTSVILAPIRAISTATPAKQIADLWESNILTEGTEFSFLKYFCLEHHEKIENEGKNGVVVDFSKCFSIRNQSYDILVENKILQLRTNLVSECIKKWSVYFYR